MKKITILFSCLLFLLCFFGGNVKAQLFTEQFNYTSTGTLAGDSIIKISGTGTPTSGIWRGHSGYTGTAPNLVPTNPQLQTATSLTYSSAPTLGGSSTLATTGLDINASFTAQTTGSVYASAIVSLATAQATGDYFLHLGQTSSVTATWNVTNFSARVFAKSSGAGFVLGFTRTSTAPTYGTTVYPFNTPIFIVVKHTFVTGTINDVVSMYVYTGNTNPPATEPGVADFLVNTETGTDPAEISKFVIRQGTAANAPTGSIDYVRVGTAWTDVTSFSATATLIANPTTITDFGSVNTNANSTASSYTLTASNLTADVTVTAPTNFQVAKGVAGTYASSVTYTIAELATAQTVGVRFAPTSGTAGVKSGNVTHSGFATTTVAVSGTETIPTPTLVANPTTIADFGSVNNGANSTASSYTLTATNLTANVTVTAPANFQVAKGVAGTYASSVIYTVAELATVQTVGVRFSPVSGVNGAKAGNITHSGFASVNVALSGTETGNAAPTPTLVANPTTIPDFGSVNNGVNSTASSYTLTATNLVADVTVTAPANFQVAKGVAGTYASSVTYTIAELATVQTVGVRFSPTSGTNGAKSGNITHSNFPTTNVAVSGTEAGNMATLVANPTTITNFGSVNNGANSTASSYTLTATNLTANVVVTAPANFQVAKGVAGTYASSVTYTVAELATVQTVGVRFSPTSGLNGAKSGNITHSGFASVNVAVSGTEAGNVATLVANPTSLANFGSVNNGSNSSNATYTLTATNLTSNVTVTAPTNFRVSKDNGTTFAQTVSYTVADLATVQTVTVRFSPISGLNGAKSGSITHSGFATTTVSVSGTETGNTGTLTPQINVKQGATTIASGGNYVYPAAQTSVTFTIENLGNINLALNSINTTGTNATEFTIIQPASNIAGSANTTFIVNITPTSSGNKSAVLNIPSNDPTTPNYTINLSASNVTSLPSQLQVGELNVYPNPSNGIFRINIKGEASRKISAQIFDVKGVFVGETKGETSQEGIFDVDFSKLTAGIYNIVLQVGKEKILKRVVID